MRARDMDRLDRKLAKLLGWMRTESDTGQPWTVDAKCLDGLWVVNGCSSESRLTALIAAVARTKGEAA